MSEPIGHPLQRYLDFKKVEEIMVTFYSIPHVIDRILYI